MSDRTVEVVVYTAKWAPGSVLLGEALRGQAGSGVSVRCVDVDAEFAQAEEWRILCLPTAVVLVDGQERKRMAGVSAADAVSVARKSASRQPRRR